MVLSTARRKITWGAMLTALIVGSALLLMLTSQSFNPHFAQAAPPAPQPLRPRRISFDGTVIAEFRTLNEAASTIELPDQSQPVSIVLERKPPTFEMSAWQERELI